jgi:O-antigen/teichoic acid export membrane protein
MIAVSSRYSISSIRRGVRIFLSGQLVSSGAGILCALCLVHDMPVDQYAYFVTALAIHGVLSAFASLGVDRVVNQFFPPLIEQNKLHTLSSIMGIFVLLRMLAVGLILTILILLPIPWPGMLGELLGQQENVNALLYYVISYILMLHLIKYQQALMNQTIVRMTMSIEAVTKLLGIAYLIFLAENYLARDAIVIYALAASLSNVILAVLTARQMREFRTASVAIAETISYQAMFQVAKHNYVQGLVGMLVEARMLRALSAAFLASIHVAAFGFFITLTDVLRRHTPIQMLLDLIEPALSARYRASSNAIEMFAHVATVLKINYLFFACIGLIILVIGEPWVDVLTQGKYHEFTWVLLVLILAAASECHFCLIRLVANVLGFPALMSQSSLLSVLLLVPLGIALWLADSWGGLLSVALVSLAVPVLRNCYVIRTLRKRDIHYSVFDGGYIRLLSLVAVIGAFGRASLMWLEISSLWQLCVATLVLIVMYLVGLWIINPFSPSQRQWLVNFYHTREPLSHAC